MYFCYLSVKNETLSCTCDRQKLLKMSSIIDWLWPHGSGNGTTTAREFTLYYHDSIHLLPSLEGDMEICSTRTYVTRGRSLGYATWRLEGDTTICFMRMWLLKTNYISLWRIIVWYYTCIAQFGGRHEDLSHPENSCRPRETWIFWVGQIFVSPDQLGN